MPCLSIGREGNDEDDTRRNVMPFYTLLGDVFVLLCFIREVPRVVAVTLGRVWDEFHMMVLGKGTRARLLRERDVFAYN